MLQTRGMSVERYQPLSRWQEAPMSSGRHRGCTAGAPSLELAPSAMSSSLPTLFVLVIILGLMAAAWFGTPKGPNQTYVCVERACSVYLAEVDWRVSQAHPYQHPADPCVLLSYVDGHVLGAGAPAGTYVLCLGGFGESKVGY